jgi:uncharacterized membrane protein YfcA
VELLVNSLIGLVLLVFGVFRGLLQWGDKALLVGVAVAVGAYLGTRAALTRHDRTGSAWRS